MNKQEKHFLSIKQIYPNATSVVKPVTKGVCHDIYIVESTNNKLENFNGNTMPKYEKRSYKIERGLWSALMHKKDGWTKRRNEDLTN